MNYKTSAIVGKKFGRLTVMKFKKESGFCTFLCECGRVRRIQQKDTLKNIFSGRWNTCGYNTHYHTHGLSSTRFFNIWSGIKQRTLNENADAYLDYGARGIKICDRWMKFENFRDDMYESYQSHAKKHGEKNTSIDRINSKGNYEPENCRWATIKQQNMNKRMPAHRNVLGLCPQCSHCKKIMAIFDIEADT